ncbi:MAG: Dyp-type peroxidase [Candidatus Binatia bacterium]
MSPPQTGIVPEPGPSALFLILGVPDPQASAPAMARAIAGVPALATKVAGLDPRARLVATVSIGPALWDALSPSARPAGLRPFRAMSGDGGSAPATGGDFLLHLTSRREDLNLELAMRVRRTFGDAVRVMEEVHGFRYLDSRDLTGFIDGTENPKGKARAGVALIGAEDRAFAGGSYVFTQRYVHDLARWATLPEKEQEQVIGRRKRDSKELSATAKPPTAHIARTVIEENGEELEIVRHSFPYGTVSEAGLFFIAYTKDLGIPEKMLARMLGTTGDGLHDHLMDFSRAVSGATFFAPSLRMLRGLAR